jgi:SM-20-related protein
MIEGRENLLLHAQDDILPELERTAVDHFLREQNDGPAGWKFGWHSKGSADTFAFWHRHFAGYQKAGGDSLAYDCDTELQRFPVVYDVWKLLREELPEGHRLIRCYANGITYGSDGTVHTDTALKNVYTTIYYPHAVWQPDWGGETIFFDRGKTDAIACVYPKPNRLVIFDGRIPHVARGVSRVCPTMRVTLMFKTDVPDAG